MIAVPLSPGELLDKITILEIKRALIEDDAKVKNVVDELSVLEGVRDREVPASTDVATLTNSLRDVNRALWKIEDDIREHERRGDFSASFVELARAVYKTNDVRASLKREVNTLLDSPIFEEKSYAAY